MKKIILVLAIATFSTGTLVAQSTANPAPAGQTPAKPVTPAEQADRLTQRMTAQLALTPEQSVKIKTINLQRVTEQQTLRQKATPDRQAIRKEMQALQQKYQAQYQAVLTPEQYAKYEASQAPSRRRRGADRLRGQSQDLPAGRQ